MNFHTDAAAWIFLRRYKGQKFYLGTRQLWHTWDRPKDEVLLSKRVSLANKDIANESSGEKVPLTKS